MAKMTEDGVDTRIVAWREAAICLGFTEGPDQISETGASERGMSSDRLMFRRINLKVDNNYRLESLASNLCPVIPFGTESQQADTARICRRTFEIVEVLVHRVEILNTGVQAKQQPVSVDDGPYETDMTREEVPLTGRRTCVPGLML